MAAKKQSVADELAKIKRANSGLKRRVAEIERLLVTITPRLDNILQRLNALAPEGSPPDRPVGEDQVKPQDTP